MVEYLGRYTHRVAIFALTASSPNAIAASNLPPIRWPDTGHQGEEYFFSLGINNIRNFDLLGLDRVGLPLDRQRSRGPVHQSSRLKIDPHLTRLSAPPARYKERTHHRGRGSSLAQTKNR